MTPDELTKVFSDAGLDTYAKALPVVQQLAALARIRQIDTAIDDLGVKRTEVLAPIENTRISLTNERNTLLLGFKT